MCKRAATIAVALVASSLALFALLPNGGQPFAIVPGVFAGMYAAWFIEVGTSGRAAGAETAIMLSVASIINFVFYTAVAYGASVLWSRFFGKPDAEG